MPAVYAGASQTFVPLKSEADIGVFAPESSRPLQEVDSNFVQVSPDDPYTWRSEYSFAGLRQGDYQLRLFTRYEVDYNLFIFDSYYKSETIVLTRKQPSAVNRDDRWDSPHWGTDGEISGRMIASGNVVPYFGLRLDDNDLAFRSHNLWQVPLTEAVYGVLPYRITGLSLGQHMLFPNDGEKLDYLEHDEPFKAYGFELTSAAPSISALDYLFYTGLSGLFLEDYDPHHMGILHVTINLSGTPSADFIIVVEREDGRHEVGDDFLRYAAVGGYGFEENTFAAQLNRINPDGAYILSIHSASNPTEVLYTYPEPIEFVPPTPPWTNPEASVSFDFTLPE